MSRCNLVQLENKSSSQQLSIMHATGKCITKSQLILQWMHWSAEPSAWIFMALNYNNAHARFPQENGRPYVWLSMEGVLDLRNGAVSDKTPQIFGPSLLAEYVTVFSGRTDTPEVRCDLTHTHTHRQTNYSNPPAHARRGLIMYSSSHTLLREHLCMYIHVASH